MAYALRNEYLYCSHCKKSHLDTDVAVCYDAGDLAQAVEDYKDKWKPKIILMSPSLSDQFRPLAEHFRAIDSKTTDNLWNGVKRTFSGLLIPTNLLFGAAEMWAAIGRGVYDEIKYRKEAGKVFGTCLGGIVSEQEGGRISVHLR